MFTLRLEPEVIRIKDAGAEVVQKNCMRCHEQMIDHTSLISYNESSGKKCWSCHEETPHGTVSSLSSFPNSRVPLLNPIIPDWLKEKYYKEIK
jgi:cytochrome c nitrite reductase small subunit